MAPLLRRVFYQQFGPALFPATAATKMDNVSHDSTDYDFNVRLICFVGLSVGVFVLSLMCLCRTYDWCRSRGYRDIYESLDEEQTENAEENDVTSPLITTTASQETTQYYSTLQESSHYYTAMEDKSISSSSDHSSERESIVIINAKDAE